MSVIPIIFNDNVLNILFFNTFGTTFVTKHVNNVSFMKIYSFQLPILPLFKDKLMQIKKL